MGESDIKFLHKDRFNPPSIQETRRPLVVSASHLTIRGGGKGSQRDEGRRGALGGWWDGIEDIISRFLYPDGGTVRPNEVAQLYSLFVFSLTPPSVGWATQPSSPCTDLESSNVTGKQESSIIGEK